MAEADPQKTFNVHDAKTNLSKPNGRAHAGEEIILAKAGEPWAKIVPFTSVPKEKRVRGGLTVTADIPVWFDPMPDEGLGLFEGKRLEKYGL